MFLFSLFCSPNIFRGTCFKCSPHWSWHIFGWESTRFLVRDMMKIQWRGRHRSMFFKIPGKLMPNHKSLHPWRLHPEKLTWNLRIHPWKRKIIFQTIIFRFYVNLLGCNMKQRFGRSFILSKWVICGFQPLTFQGFSHQSLSSSEVVGEKSRESGGGFVSKRVTWK